MPLLSFRPSKRAEVRRAPIGAPWRDADGRDQLAAVASTGLNNPIAAGDEQAPGDWRDSGWPVPTGA
jgi:hypothetical protein